MDNQHQFALPHPWQDLTSVDWAELARHHGTPFYLFDADAVASRIRDVRHAFDDTVQVYYAVKANPNLGLLRAVATVADGVDISSGGELKQAQLAGFDPRHMSFAGPAKTDAELTDAIRAGVGCISVESLREIDACARIADKLGSRAQVLLRVNPQQSTRDFGLKMGGRAVQFGIDEEDLLAAATRIVACGERLDLRGIHAYVGSQCFESAGVIEATRNALRLATEVETHTGIRCQKVNLGGGFGIAASNVAKELNLKQVAGETTPLLREFRRTRPAAELLFELGRYITCQAGIYVTTVVSLKHSRGKAFVACDGGLNHQLAAAGTFGAALRGNFPLRNLSRPEANIVSCNIAGPSCNPTDLLGVGIEIEQPHEGDLLGVLMSGSYGLTASPLLFLGRPSPTELVRSNGAITVGRKSHELTAFN